jgi:hypothetical protein
LALRAVELVEKLRATEATLLHALSLVRAGQVRLLAD